MLELAKVAYTHKVDALTKEEEKRPIQMKVCETLLTLGEVSLENETYDQAVVDITECLTKRKVRFDKNINTLGEHFTMVTILFIY